MKTIVRASIVALVVLATGSGPAPQAQAPGFQNYVDRQAIEATLVRYSTGLDTVDADVYASAFTEDAVIELTEAEHERVMTWLIENPPEDDYDPRED